MQLDLEGKVVLVTGSSRGIGKAIAQAFEREGAQVAINGTSEQNLDKARRDFLTPPLAIRRDVTKPVEAQLMVNEVVAHFGQLDVVVANVGSGQSVKPGEETLEEWQRVFTLNLFSATNVVEAAKGHLAKAAGSIICISSICGCEVIPDAPLTYSAAKAALNAYVAGVARPLGELGIKILAIAPGNVIFDGSLWQRRLTEDSKAVEQMLEANVPLKRIGDIREIAEAAVFAASPRNGFATGSVWAIDGGQTRQFR